MGSTEVVRKVYFCGDFTSSERQSLKDKIFAVVHASNPNDKVGKLISKDLVIEEQDDIKDAHAFIYYLPATDAPDSAQEQITNVIKQATGTKTGRFDKLAKFWKENVSGNDQFKYLPSRVIFVKDKSEEEDIRKNLDQRGCECHENDLKGCLYHADNTDDIIALINKIKGLSVADPGPVPQSEPQPDPAIKNAPVQSD